MQTEKKKKEKETSDLFCFQVQEMDVFDESCLEGWQTDAVIDKDT